MAGAIGVTAWLLSALLPQIGAPRIVEIAALAAVVLAAYGVWSQERSERIADVTANDTTVANSEAEIAALTAEIAALHKQVPEPHVIMQLPPTIRNKKSSIDETYEPPVWLKVYNAGGDMAINVDIQSIETRVYYLCDSGEPAFPFTRSERQGKSTLQMNVVFDIKPNTEVPVECVLTQTPSSPNVIDSRSALWHFVDRCYAGEAYIALDHPHYAATPAVTMAIRMTYTNKTQTRRWLQEETLEYKYEDRCMYLKHGKRTEVTS